jgi:predicted metal-dependent phosphoesterase TrpH
LYTADFHIHSKYSMDCSTTLEQIIKACQQKKINCIALSDHGTIEGALKIQEIAPFKVIVAEEVLTTSGEIMGMFLKEVVPSGLSMEESIARIKDQGGLVNVPHPFDKIRPSAVNGEMMDKIAGEINLVEIFNARTILQGTQKAREFAQLHNLPGTAGSDAHDPAEIGNAWVEMPEFNGKEDFLQALSQGEVFGHKTNPLRSIWVKIKKAL